MGLNFQTCTIINKNVDIDSNVEGATLFEGKDNTLRIKRDFVFVQQFTISFQILQPHRFNCLWILYFSVDCEINREPAIF